MVYRILLVKANRFFRRPDEDFLFVAFCNEAVKKAVFLELLDFFGKGALRNSQLHRNVDHVVGVVGMLHEVFYNLPRKPVDRDAVADFNAEVLIELADHVDVPHKGGDQRAVSSHPFIIHAYSLLWHESIKMEAFGQKVQPTCLL